MSQKPDDRSLIVKVGPEELAIRRRYETASIMNDFLIAIWFVIGSIFFLFPELSDAATWLFVIGSVQFLLRPMIRLTHRIHLQSVPQSKWES